MGLRSWLTAITNTGKDWDRFQKLLKGNEDAYGVHYVIDITGDVPGLSKGLWVAWSGDTGASLEPMGKYRNKTVLLDNLIDDFPEFRDPTNFGTILDPSGLTGG